MIKTELIRLEIDKDSSVSDSEYAMVRATGEIRFNNQNQPFTIKRNIEKKKKEYKISIASGKITDEVLETLGVQIDKSEIEKTFESVLKKEVVTREKNERKKREEYYDKHPMHEMLKKLEESTDREIVESDIHITSREDVLKSSYHDPDVRIRIQQHYRTTNERPNIYLTINYRCGKYELENERYNKIIKRSKYFKDVYPVIVSEIKGSRSSVDSAIKNKDERLETRDRLRETISPEIQIVETSKSSGHGSNYHSWKERHLRVFKRIGDSTSEGIGIKFDFPDSNNLITINKVQGKFTPDQVKRILDIVNERKPECEWNC